MHLFASGAAFVDRSGALVAMDPGFLALLGLQSDDPTRALQARAEADPVLRALLAGEGEETARVAGLADARIEIRRVPSGGGALLLARDAHMGTWLEHAMRSQGIRRLAAGVAHDIKNPLNAMSLQIALLVEKLSDAEPRAASSGHLGALREQIGRVNEVLRRFLDVTDPSAPLGYTDLGALVTDAVSLFGHDARRRRVEFAVEAPAGAVRTACDPERVGCIIVGLLARALGETPDAGKITVRAHADGDTATVQVEHPLGDPDPELGYYTDVVAAASEALGGGFAFERRDGTERISLTLPRNERE